MTFQLENIVPWGRSWSEYMRMFDMNDNDRQQTILGCGDGPASFNAEATAAGMRVVSVDPIYQFTVSQIAARVHSAFPEVIEQARQNQTAFCWDEFGTVEQLGEHRMRAMSLFLQDFDGGLREGRYIAAALPKLPFAAGEFNLALCSHLLFLYSEHLSGEFHIASILELLRVADEVRIFPLLTLAGIKSPYLDLVRDEMRRRDFIVSVERVPYEFQRGAHEMLRISRSRPRRSNEEHGE